MNDYMIKRISLVTSLVTATVITLLIINNGSEVLAYKRTQESLAKEVLRFHVLANSDDEQDQELKLMVKDEVVNYMQEQLGDDGDVLHTKLWVENHLLELEKIALQVVKEQGYEYKVNAELLEVDFPTKTYGDITFPAGKYEALRINIGDAKGENWWCCLYPSLCFIDASRGVVSEEGKDELESVLTEDEYDIITTKSEFKFKWFFFDR